MLLLQVIYFNLFVNTDTIGGGEIFYHIIPFHRHQILFRHSLALAFSRPPGVKRVLCLMFQYELGMKEM